MLKRLIFAGAVLLFALLSIKVNARAILQQQEAPLYKNVELRKLEKQTPVKGLSIVVPQDPLWKALGVDIAEAIKRKWKLKVDVVEADQQKFAAGWAGPTLVLGNLANNKQMARLYGLSFAYADAVYPGKAGYHLLTIIDPFGLGGNTITIGASDLDGARQGTQEFIKIVQQQNTPSIPWVMEAKISEPTKAYFDNLANSFKASTVPQYTKRAQEALARLQPVMNDEPIKNFLLSVRSSINMFGEYYLLTGSPGYKEMYRQLLIGYAKFLNRYPKEANNQLVWKNMWKDGEKIFQTYDLLEGGSIFNDSERKEILSALYLTCEANSQDPYLRGAKEKASRWNHEIFPAMSLVGSCRYFETHFKLPEVDQWSIKGHRIFKGNTSYISLDEGSDYLVHVPMVTIDYAMFTGQESFMHKSLRPSAELHSMMIDNLGTMTGGGDTYPFGRSSAYSWGHSQVMYAASWFFNDPKYNFLLENAFKGPFPKQGMTDLDYPIHKYMATHSQAAQLHKRKYPKLQAQEVEPGVYQELKLKEELNVPQSATFHKMAFRSGFGFDDSYLVLDGFSAGTHGHEDGNAILDYSANGRLFLVDRDYIQKSPENHSGIVVVKNGEQFKKPALTKLEWVGDVDGTTISKSGIIDYNGTDWDRTIMSPDGKFFIIYDDLTFKAKGNYLLRNLWQSLGTAKVENNSFKVDQKGVVMSIQSLGKGNLGLKNIYGHFQKYWKMVYTYPYAEYETVLSQDIVEKEYQKGEVTGFISVLSSSKEGAKPVASHAIDASTVMISSNGKQWIAIREQMNAGNFSSNGKLHLIGEHELVSVAASQVKIGTQELNFKTPVFFKLNVNTGEWKTYSLLKNKLSYDKSGKELVSEALESGKLNWSTAEHTRLLANYNNKKVNPITAQSRVSAPANVKNQRKVYSFNEQVTSSSTGDLDGDGKEEILLGGIKGKLTAIAVDGKPLWTFKALGRINEVSVQTTGSKSFVFIATENWYVHVLDLKGNELWKYKFPNDKAHAETKGNMLGISNVRLAYINGKDKAPSVMVGTQFRFVYELDLEGKLIRHSLLYYYGIEDMEFADLDGDGKDEGVMAMEYYNFVVMKGKTLTSSRRNLGGPGWKIVEMIKNQENDGLSQVLLGTKQREVMLIQFRGKIEQKWSRNVGGEVNALKQGLFSDQKALEILVGTEGFQFYVLKADGSTVFKKTLENRVLKVNGYQLQGKANYMAATAGGKLFEFSDAGVAKPLRQFNDEVAAIHVIKNTIPTVILENGEVYQLN